MGKKFGKFLLFTAAVGAAGAAAYYYMQKKDNDLLAEYDDDDYDDFSEDMEDESGSRTYVPLNQDVPSEEGASTSQDSASEEEDFFTPLADQVQQASETVKDEVEEAVEEFFDDEETAPEE